MEIIKTLSLNLAKITGNQCKKFVDFVLIRVIRVSMLREYSISAVSLLKGIVYDHQKDVWENLLQYEPEIIKYFGVLGLEVYLDKSEGYAYLRQKELEP